MVPTGKREGLLWLLLDLPILTYDAAVQDHRKLAELGDNARHEADAIVKSPNCPAATSLPRQRAFVRENLRDILAEINRLVRRVL